jgi:hypothetical protein
MSAFGGKAYIAISCSRRRDFAHLAITRIAARPRLSWLDLRAHSRRADLLQAAIDKSQEFVTGSVRLKLYKGNVGVVGRESKYSLYDQDLVTFEDGKVAYDQGNAEGLIRLSALRLRTLARRRRKFKP